MALRHRSILSLTPLRVAGLCLAAGTVAFLLLPRESAQQRLVRELHRQQVEAERPRREEALALIRRLENHPVAIENEKKLAGLTPAQRAVHFNALADAWKARNGLK